MGHWTANLSGWLIGPQTLVDHLPQQIIFRPGQIFDFRDKLGPHPMHATDDEGRAKAAFARRWHLQWHVACRHRLEAAPQTFKLRIADSGSDAPGIDQPTVGS